MRLMNYQERMAKAVQNENFLEQCGSCMEEHFLDWMITVMFYAALHYVSAILEKKYNVRVKTHAARDTQLAAEPSIRNDYKLLYDDGMLSRYDKREFSKEHVEESLRPALNRIRNAAATICRDTPL